MKILTKKHIYETITCSPLAFAKRIIIRTSKWVREGLAVLCLEFVGKMYQWARMKVNVCPGCSLTFL